MMFRLSTWMLLGMVAGLHVDKPCFVRSTTGYEFSNECTQGETGDQIFYMKDKAQRFVIDSIPTEMTAPLESKYIIMLTIGGCEVEFLEDQTLGLEPAVRFEPKLTPELEPEFTLDSMLGSCAVAFEDGGLLDGEKTFKLTIHFDIQSREGPGTPVIHFKGSFLSDEEIQRLGQSSGFPVWAIVLISVVGAGALVTGALLFWFLYWKGYQCDYCQRRREKNKDVEAQPEHEEKSKKEKSQLDDKKEESQPRTQPAKSPEAEANNNSKMAAKEEKKRIPTKDIMKK